MNRYDRQYDYGMRGFRQTTRPIGWGRGPYDRFGRYDAPYRMTTDERSYPRGPRPNRVTARYNLDYVVGYPERYDQNYNMYTGDRMDRIGDERYYRRPYLTIGGTRTLRGSSFPTGYDYPDYGPSYGGRFPDEL
jgi:hypothetical protein